MFNRRWNPGGQTKSASVQGAAGLRGLVVEDTKDLTATASDKFRLYINTGSVDSGVHNSRLSKLQTLSHNHHSTVWDF
jgi:hypothetical protein